MRGTIACLAAAVWLAGAPAGLAQAPPKPPETHAARVDELARVLGRAHYLRVLCAGLSDQSWRNAMRSLLDVEARNPGPRRGALVGIFNEGYRYEQERFPVCDESAEEAGRALAGQGKRLSDALAARFREP